METKLKPWKTCNYKSPAERKLALFHQNTHSQQTGNYKSPAERKLQNFHQNTPYKLATFKDVSSQQTDLKPRKIFEHGPDLCMGRHTLYRDAHAVKRVGIKNVQPITVDQFGNLKKAMVQEILKMENGTGPSFLEVVLKDSFVIAVCSDQASREWVIDTVPKLKPWPDADLSIMSNTQLPIQMATVYVSGNISESYKDALHLVQVQNKGLNPELWKVVMELVKTRGREMTFTVDEESAEALRERGNRASLGFKQAPFKFIADPCPKEVAPRLQ